MTSITFVLLDGTTQTLDGAPGATAMQVATGAGLDGIVAECGGSAMCATCHVYIDPAWLDKLPPPAPNELEMLECTSSERRLESRLSCQVKMNAALDGLVVRMPATQQ